MNVVGAKVLGTFAPWGENSRERKFLGAKVLGTSGGESSREGKFLGSLPGVKVSGSKSSIIPNLLFMYATIFTYNRFKLL